MTNTFPFQRVFATGLSLALLASLAIPVMAEETADCAGQKSATTEPVVIVAATQPVQTTEPTPQPSAAATEPPATEATQPPATEATQPPATEATQPPVTEATQPPAVVETEPSTTLSTEPAQTTAPTTEPTQAAATDPTVSETSVPETEGETESSESSETAAETGETTIPTETADLAALLLDEQPLSIAQVKALETGTEEVLTRGTVVYAANTMAVLQDSTGGIRLSFSQTPVPGLKLGDVLLVAGARSGGLAVTEYLKEGKGDIPTVESTLASAEDDIRVHIQNATLGSNVIEQEGFSVALVCKLPKDLEAGDTVEAWGVCMDGAFYADTIRKQEIQIEREWNLYFGNLHAHTAISDGSGTVEEAFLYASQVPGLDFFAVTDYSDSFDNTANGSIHLDGRTISADWAAGKLAAQSVTNESFVGIFGYEMGWGLDTALGHINTFNTAGWQNWEQPGFSTLAGYYEVLANESDSVSQFNHPGGFYGDFEMFGNYDPRYDAAICLLEVGGENGYTAYEYYTAALDKGWHVAPTNNQSSHNGKWGDASSARTVVLSKGLTEQELYSAMKNRRVYATEDSDLEVTYRLNGQIMGSIIGTASSLTAQIEINDLTDSGNCLVEIVTEKGATVVSQMVSLPSELTISVPSRYDYYYLRITQADGDVAVTAPVWVDAYDSMGIWELTASEIQPKAGEAVTLDLTLFNNESIPFILESIRITTGKKLIQEINAPGTIEPLNTFSCSFLHTWKSAGEKTVTATVTGTAAGEQRTYTRELVVRVQAEKVTQADISAVRAGSIGRSYRIKGYLTSGNTNPYNTFPNTLYIQDDSGGIAVVGRFPDGLQVGTAMEITGCLRKQSGNLVLELTDWSLPDEAMYRHVPRIMTHDVAMNYDVHGGELLQIEGTVVSLTEYGDGKGVSRFTLRDIRGDLATVIVEDFIASSSYGVNELAAQVRKGRVIRAMGLLHVDEYGSTVLRVRNCDEVVYVPPMQADLTNPKTGDRFIFWK